MGDLTSVRVALDDLVPHPDNRRIGDVGIVVESLERLGQYRALGVQTSSGYLVFGNHTREALLQLRAEYRDLTDAEVRKRLKKAGALPETIKFVVADRWTTAAVTYLDVDDDTAKRILTVDNRSQQMGDFDWEGLTSDLDSMLDLTATGFTRDEVDALVEWQKWEHEQLEQEEDEEWEDVDEIEEPEAGVRKLNTDVTFKASNPWDIPEYRLDMIPSVDDEMSVWAGPLISERDDDGQRQFLYNYSSDSTRGMPWERTFVAFYVRDQRFENWWASTDVYVEKMLRAGVAGIVAPDYSMYGDTPRSVALFNLYRQCWIGRFAQEAGLMVIPNLAWFDSPTTEWAEWTIPVGAPTVCVQKQAGAGSGAEAHNQEWADDVRRMYDTIQWEKLVVYGGKAGHEFVRSQSFPFTVVYVRNRSDAKDDWREERDGHMSDEEE